MTGALLLPLGAIAPAASAAPGDANPPEPQSTAQLCAPVPDSYDPFTDISGNVHERAIECAAYADIARGGPGSLPDSRYGPAMDVRRDQMASFIARMMDTAERLDTGDNIRPLPAYDGTPAFTDVSQSSVHFEAINRLEQADIVQGGPGPLPSDQYGPELPTRRDQMASFINRAIGYMTGSPMSSENDYFVDDESSVHEDNINGIASAAIAVGGGEDSYNPFVTVPRDQMASFLMRTLAVLHENGQIQQVEQAGTSTGQTFVVAPQQPQETQAGEPLEWSIGARYDDQDFAGPVDLTLFPCPNVEATSSPVTFTDANDDGLADGIASTENDQAYYSEVEGTQTGGPELYLQDQGPGTDGVLNFTTIAGPGGDCAVVVAFDDENDDQQLSVDDQGRPTEPFGVGKGTWTGDGGGDSGQTFSVAPMEPVETAAGEPVEISVIGRNDDQAFTGPVDLTLFPCPNADATASPVTFTDADDDGLADGIASTEQDQAYISQVEGTETGGRELYLQDQGPGNDDILEFTTIAGPGADCAVVTVFDDQNDDQQLSVDDQGRPTEPFGVTKASWTGGESAVEIAAVDADGRAVVLDGQTGEVLRVLLEGVNVEDPADNAVAVTPDRSTAYVVRPGATGAQDSQIVRIPMAGGTAEDVTQGNAPALRPDGQELAYVRFVDTGQTTPQPSIRLRNLNTGGERAIPVGPQQDYYGIWDLSWTDDGTRIAFTAGEIGTGVHIVERTAATLDEAQRLGPENTEASWDDVASLGGDQLAVIEQCCNQPDPDPQTWHVVTVDANDGSVNAEIFGQDRTEAVEIDDRDDGTGLLAVENRGTTGGTLLRWNGSNSSVRTLTDNIVVAAW